MWSAAAGDERADLQFSDQAAVLVVVVAAVGQDDVGSLAGPAAFAPDLGDGVQQGQQLGDIVAVGSGEDHRERNAGGIGNQVVFASSPPSVDG